MMAPCRSTTRPPTTASNCSDSSRRIATGESSRRMKNGSGENLILRFVRIVGQQALFFFTLVAQCVPAFARPRLVVHQIYNAGARSLIIIMLSGLFVGMALGLLGFDLLQKFGSE